MEKIKNIEFLKFLFIIIVIISHLFTPWGSLPTFFPEIYGEGAERFIITGISAYIFYFIAGFFIYYKNRNKKELSVTKYTIKRYLRFFPLVFSYIIAVVFIVAYNNHFSLTTISNAVFYMLLLNSTGLPIIDHNFSVLNFLSSIFWASVIIYAFMRVFEEKYANNKKLKLQ